jgi:hypothetical protein
MARGRSIRFERYIPSRQDRPGRRNPTIPVANATGLGGLGAITFDVIADGPARRHILPDTAIRRKP